MLLLFMLEEVTHKNHFRNFHTFLVGTGRKVQMIKMATFSEIITFVLSGLLGILLEPFFAQDEGIFWKGNTLEPWKRLGINAIGGLCIISWSAVWSVITFGVLKSHKLLRIDDNTENFGHDLLHHGEAAYPIDAWMEYQYKDNISKNMGDDSTPVDKLVAKVRHFQKDKQMQNYPLGMQGKQFSFNLAN